MNVPSGVIFPYKGTHAGIPTGWDRETTLDSRYIKGAANGIDPNGTGGATTHSHSAAASHSHTMNAHTHSTTIGAHPKNEQPADGGVAYALASHTHNSGSITSGAASGGALSSVAATYASVANDPPYRTVIFIKSDGTTAIPHNALIFLDSTTVPSGFERDSDFDGKYLKGAATGADAGTTGGSTTNVHTLTHTHTVASHSHASVVTGAPPTGTSSSTTSDDKLKSHTHTISYGSRTATLTGSVSLTTGETVEPSHKELYIARNTSGQSQTPNSGTTIGLWLGTLATIPSGWDLVSAMEGYYAKMTGTAGDIGNTGGSNSHTHAAQNHTHTGVAHNHTASGGAHTGVDNGGGSGSDTAKSADPSYSHTLTVGNTTATYANASTSASSTSNEPLYRTVAFIKFTAAIVDVEESIAVSESLNQALVDTINVSDSASASEYTDHTIRDGLQISIWKENITARDQPQFPGPRDGIISDTTDVSESVTIKITSEETDTKPTIKVKY